MGVVIPQVVTTDRATGAQVIDGSLKFDAATSEHLKRTPGSASNRRTWTWAAWVKRSVFGADKFIFSAGSDASNQHYLRFKSDNKLEATEKISDSTQSSLITNAVHRDTGWYHLVYVFDSTQSTSSDRVSLYVNGVKQTSLSTNTYPSQNHDSYINNTSAHYVGSSPLPSAYYDGGISQVYLIDGQALGPEYFGYTDGLTNTWKPKKYEGTFGTNGFYLPMDGNSLIGKDQSGNGNDWTPVNIGGSVGLDKATGAKPILNTTQGGAQAGVGVFGSSQNVGYAVTVYDDGGGNKYYIDGVKQDTVTGLIRGATYTFDTSDSTVSSHPFRFSATSNGSHGGGSEYTNGVAAITGTATTITVPHDAPNTLYYYCTSHSGMGADITGITTNEKLADQYASHCVLALPLVGVSDDVSVSVACTSTAKAITSNGTVAASNVESNIYSGSFLFDGDSDYFTFAPGGDFAFGTADFTIECWCYSKNRGTYDYIIEGRNSGQTTGTWTLVYGYSGANPSTLEFATGSTTLLTCPTASNPEADRWFHVAITRSGTSLKMFIDGVEVTSATDSTNFSTSPSTSYIGTRYSQQHYWDGYMQDIRVYKGVAKYTSDFAVPSRSPNVLPDTPSGVSGGSKLTKITEGSVSFDGTGDYLSLADNDDFDLGTGDFTFEAFFNQTLSHTNYRYIFSHYDGSNGHWLRTDGDGPGRVQFGAGGTAYITTTTKVALNKWYHVAVVRVGTTVTLYLDGIREGTYTLSGDITSTGEFRIGRQGSSTTHYFGGFISNVRINKGSAIYTGLRITPPSAPLTNVTNTKLLCCQSNSEGPQKTAVIPSVTGTATAMWPLDSDINDDSGNSNTLTENGGSTSFTSAASNSFGITNAANFAKDGKYLSYAVTPASAWTIDGYIRLETTTTSAPYILGWDGQHGSRTCLGFPSDGSRKFSIFGSSNLNTDVVAEVGRWYHIRITTSGSTDLALYVDGVLLGRSTTSDGGPASPITIGDVQSGRFSGQIAGVRYTPTDLGAPPLGGETTSSGVTSNSPSVGVSLAGDVEATTFNPFNTDIHTVRGQESGYPTWSPLVASTSTFSDGNLKITTQASGYVNDLVTMQTPAGTGRWYWEFVQTARTGTDYTLVGMLPDDNTYKQGSSDIPQNCGGIGLYIGQNGVAYVASGAATAGTTSATFDVGDVLGWAYDAENGTVKCFKNGVPQGTQFTNVRTDTGWTFCVTDYDNTTVSTFEINFGQKPFKFSPPDGYQSLNTANTRPVKVISRPDQYVGIVTYTGDGNSPRKISGYNFAPDLIWYKQRNTGRDHQWYDTVRGSGSNKNLSSNTTYIETANDDETYGYTSAFNENGFTVTEGSSNFNYANADGSTYVAWAWKAGGNKNTFNVDDVGYASAAAAGLTAGTLTISGASVGTKQGFSIIKYAGSGSNSTFPHGLTQAPDFYIIKCLDVGSEQWRVYHSSLGADYALTLSGTAAKSDSNLYFNDTEPTSTVASVYAGYDGVNNTGRNYISYLWHNVPGLQKFGSYEGNGTADGPFIELGFRASVIIAKNADNADDWVIADTTRSSFNVQDETLFPNSSNGEDTGTFYIDILSNGFKPRHSSGKWNSSGHTFVYMAWAEAPSVDLYGGGSNAR